MSRALTAMSYPGGKAGSSSSTNTGPWVCSKIPWNKKDTYVEAFAGMLGILLKRQACSVEIINDLDNRVINWWRVVRDEPEKLARKIALTPRSRLEFERMKSLVVDESASPLDRALAFTVLYNTGVTGYYAIVTSKEGSHYNWRNGLDERIVLLAERIRNVQVEHMDAVDLVERVSNNKDVVLYLDPPYKETTVTKSVYQYDFDRDRMTSILNSFEGKVAISGYGDEWDHLKWKRHSFNTHTKAFRPGARTRTEVLWTNYEEGGQSALFD